MARLFLFVFAVLDVLVRTAVQSPSTFQANVPYEVVWAERDGIAELPCDVRPARTGDRVIMVLWFKESNGIPLYSVDARDRNLADGLHSALSSNLGSRSYFQSGPARLRVTRVTERDQGIFRCRVDFLNSPTRNYRINLTLIDPPNGPQIFYRDGTEVKDVAGPYLEGQDVFLTCIVTDGEPTPAVSWWLGDRMIDNDSDKVLPGRVINNIVLSVLRNLQNNNLSCQALSTPSSTPVVKTIKLQLYLKPQTVKIVSSSEAMSAGMSKHLMCETEGSHPPATISWLLDGEPIKQAATMVAIGLNRTSSTLTLRPEWDDDGKMLTCRAINPKIPGAIVEDRRYLRITYAPIASVRVASDSGQTILSEGHPVKLVCDIKANPPAESVIWYHGGDLVRTNESMNVLSIDSLSPHHAGEYSCFVRNREGVTRSKPISIAVKYAPMCKEGMEEIQIGVVPRQTIEARCEVDALPSGKHLKFSWTFNSSKDVVAIPGAWVKSHDSVSVLPYTPIQDRDFGTLACWAENPVGQQTRPCVIHLVRAKLPEPPKSCKVLDRALDKVDVVCEAGDNGGIDQHFILEVLDNHGEEMMGDEGTGQPLYRMLAQSPRFTLQSLQHEKRYKLMIYSKNLVGRSMPPVVLDDVHLPTAMERLARNDIARLKDEGGGGELDGQPWTPAVLALSTIGGLVMVGLVALCVTYKIRRQKEKPATTPLNNLGPSIRIRYPDATEDAEEF
ncbi:CD80-like C2-set immunoglobulin domain [Nesidiocoris tenuis]|uniref:CD80-like C2-set immunoglobulin domain n=1 Tax=Nesidiocoris tenuis TaxID=355587 RepID=A0ABN7AFA6_9HEMI|nr:CD80-like C2-set immunoglobulin domain [Nesidiocoris tenuis]